MSIGGVGDLIVGGQHVYVDLISSNVVPTSGQRCNGTVDATKKCFAFDVAIKNLIPQPMGTTDGVSPVPTGLQIFFVSGPTMTGGSGSISVANGLTGIFTATGQKYFQYAGSALGGDGILSQNETSSTATWQLEMDATVANFAFQLYVSAPVPKPDGYIDIATTSGGSAVTTATVSRGATAQLYPTAKAAVGRTLGASEYDTHRWASSNTSVATVDATTGVVTGVANGTAIISDTTTKTANNQRIAGAVTVTVTSATPSVTADSYDVQNGVALSVTTFNGVLANDSDADDGTSALTVTKTADVAHGTLTLNANGTFTYLPDAGYAGTDGFSYTASDGSSTSSAATVTLTVSGHMWWVDGASSGAHDGRQATPFLTLTDAEAVASTGDTILVAGSGSSTGATLKGNQAVIGAGIAASLTRHLNATYTAQAQDITLFTATGTQSPVTGDVTVASGNSLAGIAIAGTLSGSSIGTLSVATTSITNPTGAALSLSTGTLVGGFTSIVSGTGPNVTLGSISTVGTFDLGGASSAISGASTALEIIGGSGSFSYAGSISSSGTVAVNIGSTTGGTLTFSGAINPITAGGGISVNGCANTTVVFSGTTKKISTGNSLGVLLSSNTGSSISFTNGGLDIATTAGTAFSASSSGTLEISGAGNVVAVSGAANNAVSLSSLTIGANGITFASITSSGTTNGSAFVGSNLSNVSGSAFTAGSLTVAGTAGATSRGLQLASNAAPFTFGTVSINGTNAQGMYLSLNTGAVTINGGTVGNSASTAGDALLVSGGSGNVTVAAAITKSTAGRIANIGSRSAGNVTVSGALSCSSPCSGIIVSGSTGGTIDFSGATKTLTTATSPGVALSSNPGATVNFSNGGLAITTTTANGFNVTGGGTVSVTTGTNANTITSNTGTALNVTNTTIGASGLNFKSISANGGSNGITLVSTGSSGGLTVTGDGTTASNGSGGTIQNTTGADGLTTGNGIYLSNVKGISLSQMNFTGTQNNGISGTSVNGLTINKSRFTGSIGNSNSVTYQEAPVRLNAPSGAVTISNSRLDGGAYSALVVLDGSSTLTVDHDTVSTMQGSTADARGSALQLTMATGSVTANIHHNSITYWWINALQVSVAQAAGSSTALVQNNQLLQTSGAVNLAGGIEVNGGNLGFNISSNTITGSDGIPISVDRNIGTAVLSGTIEGNTIGTSGVANSGSANSTGIYVIHTGPGTTTVKVSNNVVRQINGTQAIWTQIGDDVAGGGAGSLNATVTNNTISEEGSVATTRTGIVLTSGRVTNDTDAMCADVSGNSISAYNTRIRPNQRFNTTMKMPGYTGASGDPTAVNNFVQSRNPGTIGLTSVSTVGGGGVFNTAGGAACTQPSM